MGTFAVLPKSDNCNTESMITLIGRSINSTSENLKSKQ